MNFGSAITELKAGLKVAREGWNGKGIFIELQVPDENSKMSNPYIYIDTTGLETDNVAAPKVRVPWLASQTDMLANDWVRVGTAVDVEETVEAEILRKGLTGPRVTVDQIDALIMDEDYHVFVGSQMTVCCLTLRNGFNVTGTSACAYPGNFDAEIGRSIAKRNAVAQIWALEGYLLKEDLYAGKYATGNCTCNPGEGCNFCPPGEKG